MRRNIFTSYIICNRLNLKTFFEPIINFIEIGVSPPPRTVYENFISYSSNKKRPKYSLKQIWNIKFSISLSLLFKDMKESKCESSSLWLNAKKSSQLVRFYVVLASWIFSITYLYCFFIWYLYGMGMRISSCFLYYW